MAVAFVAAGTPVQTGDVTKPSGLTNGSDVMIAIWVTRGETTFGDMSGTNWTKITEAEDSGPDTGSTVAMYWSVAHADDAGPWGADTADVRLSRAIILAYSGVDTEDAVDAFATNHGIGPDVTWASVTAAESTMIIGANSHVTAGTSVSTPSGCTVRWPPASASGGEAQGYAWDKSVSAGATGTFGTTFPGGESDGWGAITLALRPLQPKWDVGTIGWGSRGLWS